MDTRKAIALTIATALTVPAGLAAVAAATGAISTAAPSHRHRVQSVAELTQYQDVTDPAPPVPLTASGAHATWRPRSTAPSPDKAATTVHADPKPETETTLGTTTKADSDEANETAADEVNDPETEPADADDATTAPPPAAPSPVVAAPSSGAPAGPTPPPTTSAREPGDDGSAPSAPTGSQPTPTTAPAGEPGDR